MECKDYYDIDSKYFWIYNNIFIIKTNFNNNINLLNDAIVKYKCTQIIFIDYSYFRDVIKYLYVDIYYKSEIFTGSKFNNTINNINENIKHITFGFMFNQLVDNLPNSLTHLTFGIMFNQTCG